MKWLLLPRALALGIAAGLLFSIGGARYGGGEALVLRVRAEFAAYRAHPSFVPTPLPTPTTGRADNSPDTAKPAPPTLTRTGPIIPSPPSTPTEQPTATSTATPSPTLDHHPAAQTVELTGFAHAWQTWNNCGPATLAMHLSYFGSTSSQAEVAAVLRSNGEDRNISPKELASFARSQGFQALARVNGDADRIRLLLSNGVPVLIETWLEPEPGDGMGHYRLLTGYDNAQQEWIAYDVLVSTGVAANRPYRGIRLPYVEVAQLWAVFNRAYVLVYTEDFAPAVLSILGQDADEASMWQRALLSAEEEVQQRSEDAFAWFNLGTDLVVLGESEKAAAAYDRARVIGLPWRMLWYQFGPFQAYYETDRYEELIALADATIALTSDVEKLFYWKGLGLQAMGDSTGARRAFQRALALNPNYVEAANALATVRE